MKGQLFVDAASYPAFIKENKGAIRRKLRKRIYQHLKEKAANSFEDIRPLVKELQKSKDLEGVRRYFIVNGFAARASARGIAKLAASPHTEFLYKKPRRLPSLALPANKPDLAKRIKKNRPFIKKMLSMWKKAKEQAKKFDYQSDAMKPTWNLKRVQADLAWKAGATGKGVLIAIIDDSLLPTPSLIGALWRNPKEELNGMDDDSNGLVDDIFGWDFRGRANDCLSMNPRQRRPFSHGSMCSGILAGRPTPKGDTFLVTGIAPEAQLLFLRGSGLQAYEYAVEKGADVLSMSYMWVGLPLGNWRGLYRLAHEHMAAMGIVAVGGAGNFGKGGRRPAPQGYQIALPKDIPCVIAAAGIDKDGKKAPASSEGPCFWEGVRFYSDYPKTKPLQKPDLTGIFTGYPCWVPINPRTRRLFKRLDWEIVHEVGDGFGLCIGPGGNSFSGPHAGGVAALLLSKFPDLPAWEVKRVLEATAKDLGKKGWDPTFGAGLLQALKAIKAVK
jgi:subtilisin family serine protease